MASLQYKFESKLKCDLTLIHRTWRIQGGTRRHGLSLARIEQAAGLIRPAPKLTFSPHKRTRSGFNFRTYDAR